MDKNNSFDNITEVQRALTRYKYPILAAFYKGLTIELTESNPYTGNYNQMFSKRKTWRLAFYKAFEQGRKLKIKHNILIQQKLF